MKIYTFYTDSHLELFQIFKDNLPSEDRAELVTRHYEQDCMSGNFMSDGWNITMKKKVAFIQEALDLTPEGEWFVHADCDIVLFKGWLDTWDKYNSRSWDMLIQYDYTMLCAGFFFCKSNQKTKSLWKNIADNLHKFQNDQVAMNFYIKTMQVPVGILSNRYFNYGYFKKGEWTGQDFTIPDLDKMCMFHANWTVGVENKKLLMNKAISDKRNQNNMIISKFENIFQYEKFPVEHLCYMQMQNAMYENTFNYIAIPWTQIMNSNWLDFPNKKDIHQYITGIMQLVVPTEDNFTVCQHDDYMKLIPLFKHLKIKKVFSPLHDRNNYIDDIEILPIPFTCNFKFDKSITKDILFSFVGTPTSHPIRQRMAQRILGEDIIYRDSYHVDSNFFFTENYKKAEETEYQDVMERSRFSLCPRGSSPSSVRFWESIAAGTIPILISDNWVLPDWDWENSIIRIPEDQFETMDYSQIYELLNNISAERESEMRRNCLNASNVFSQEKFAEYIISKLK